MHYVHEGRLYRNLSLKKNIYIQFGEWLHLLWHFLKIVFPGTNEPLQNLYENADTKRGFRNKFDFFNRVD